MNKNHLIVVLLIAFCAVNAQKKVVSDVKTANAFSDNSIYKIDKPKAHPYLYFTDSKINETKERIKSDTTMANAWERMRSKADEIVKNGRGGDMVALSLAYRMTLNKDYAKEAKRILQDLLNRKAWDGLDDRTPRWNSALGTGHNSGLAATVFDAIYDYLTPQERKEMANRIVELGIKPSIDDWTSTDKRLHTLNSMGHNWWSALVFQSGVASLAVMTEVPEAKKWASDAMEAAEEWFAFKRSVLENKVSNFDPKGGFYESIGYANYGLGEYLFFRLSWSNAVKPFKADYDSILTGTMNWFMEMSYPNMGQLNSLNFGDGSVTSNGERPMKLMLALGFEHPNYHWYLNQTRKGAIREDLSINTPLGLVYNPKLKQVSEPSLPTSSLYSNMGWASLRNSWKENATLFGIKSGYTWNHAHADASSFILFHNGKNLLIDGGNVNYGNPLYSSYSVRSDAHNVVLFDGKAQEYQDQYHGVKTPGSLHNLIDGGKFKYILADATGPTSRTFLRNFRNIVWVGNVILIIDDVKAHETGQFEWLLHTGVDAKKKGIDFEVTDENAGVLVRPLFPETLPNGFPHDFPEKMRWKELQGVKDHDPKTMVNYYSFMPPFKAQQTKFITAVLLLDDKNKPLEGSGLGRGMAVDKEMRSNLPKIERLEGKDMIGVRITENGEVTDIFVNLLADGRLMHRNSHNVIEGWETDAYILGFSYKEGKTAEQFDRFFTANGSYARKSDNVILSSLSKVFMLAEPASGKVELQGQPVMKVHFKAPQKTSKWTVNGADLKTSTGVYSETIFRINEF